MIKIITFVDTFKHYEEPIKEFQKRLGSYVELVKIKPSKQKEIPLIIKDETRTLKTILEKEKGYKALLYIESEMMDTIKFTNFIEETKNNYPNLIFVIGGAFGVDFDVIKDQINKKISFSPMTFPHSQAIMMLYEQIYRAQCITKGTGYHH